jgi:hypothetical protein
VFAPQTAPTRVLTAEGDRRRQPRTPASSGASLLRCANSHRSRCGQEHAGESAAAPLRAPGRQDPAGWRRHTSDRSPPCKEQHRPGITGGVSVQHLRSGEHPLRSPAAAHISCSRSSGVRGFSSSMKRRLQSTRALKAAVSTEQASRPRCSRAMRPRRAARSGPTARSTPAIA